MIIYVGISAFLGAIVAALLGWTESLEPFDVKKFCSSLIRGIVGAVGIAVAFDYAGSTGLIMYLLAFIAGIGVDAGGNRIAGAIAARMAK